MIYMYESLFAGNIGTTTSQSSESKDNSRDEDLPSYFLPVVTTLSVIAVIFFLIVVTLCIICNCTGPPPSGVEPDNRPKIDPAPETIEDDGETFADFGTDDGSFDDIVNPDDDTPFNNGPHIHRHNDNEIEPNHSMLPQPQIISADTSNLVVEERSTGKRTTCSTYENTEIKITYVPKNNDSGKVTTNRELDSISTYNYAGSAIQASYSEYATTHMYSQVSESPQNIAMAIVHNDSVRTDFSNAEHRASAVYTDRIERSRNADENNTNPGSSYISVLPDTNTSARSQERPMASPKPAKKQGRGVHAHMTH